MTPSDDVPLRDRVALWLILPALVPYVVALCGAWWFLRHGDDGVEVIEVGSWPVAFMLSAFLGIALASALSTAWLLLGRPSVYWHRALPFRRVAPHLIASGLMSLIAVTALTGWIAPVAELAGLALPFACVYAFVVALSPRVLRGTIPSPKKLSVAQLLVTGLFIAVAVSAVVTLEFVRGVGERETIAAYAAAALLGLPWSALLFPVGYVGGIFAGDLGAFVFDAVVIVSLAINVWLLLRLVASKQFRSRATSKFFRLGPTRAEAAQSTAVDQPTDAH